jgi:hypothetical protein
MNKDDEKIINNINYDNNFSLLNNNSGENANNNSLINLLNEISGNDSQKDKQTTTSKNKSKNSDEFSNEIIKINIRPHNNLVGKSSYNIYIIYYYFYL